MATLGLVALWALTALLLVVGVAGTILPALPGTLLIFVGVFLGAWIDDFTRVSSNTVLIVGLLMLLGWVSDYFAAMLGAKRAGASREAIIGAAIGTVVGIFFSFVGLLFFPLIGAAVGEYLAISDLRRAGNVGIATWMGMIAGAILKLALSFIAIGIFLWALIF